uniref:Uncharacterized protein n=1 Tax=Globisporangium ultimum (strain ATCC 200006 / CBS 805.95 / DAOM BR144) TaxID=431595 RepID=K3WHA8_GLOUD
MNNPGGGEAGLPQPPDPGGANPKAKATTSAKRSDAATAPMNFKAAVSREDEVEKEQIAWTNRLTKIATRPWKEQANDNLHPMVKAEEEVLAAWMMDALVLDSSPAFLVCTHTRIQRLASLDYFETYLEGLLIATVPPIVRMPEHLAERTLLAQMVSSEKDNTPGHALTCSLVRQVKRANYNGATRRISIIVKNKMAADAWHRATIVYKGAKLLSLSPSKLDEEDVQMDIDNDAPHAGALLRYQVRVLTRDMSATIVEQVLGLSTDYEIISVTRQSTR